MKNEVAVTRQSDVVRCVTIERSLISSNAQINPKHESCVTDEKKPRVINFARIPCCARFIAHERFSIQAAFS
jgi:hypothetical protein